MRSLIATCDRVASCNVPVLLCGETGTGKEVVARHIHENSPRSNSPIIPVNCAALPKELIESEMFGALRGAYTDSKADRGGLVHAAEGGTLFLDELNEMPLSIQAKLLRVLQEKKVRRVGSTKETPVNFRLVCAVSKLPEQLLDQKRLRPELYYRIGAITLYLPRLRNRKDDVIPISETFLNYYAEEFDIETPCFLGDRAKEVLLAYDWPGNVRQLENEIQRALALGYRSEIPPESFSPAVLQAKPDNRFTPLQVAEMRVIKEYFTHLKGNYVAVAKAIGMGRQTLYGRVRHYGLEDFVNSVTPEKHKHKRRRPDSDAEPGVGDETPEFSSSGSEALESPTGDSSPPG